MALTKVPSNLDATVSTTQSASDNSTNVATTAYVTTAIANLSDSAPAALNTLNEIAAALGDDANYASTTTAAIAAKLPLAGGTMTGNLNIAGGAADMALTVRNSASGTSSSDGLSITVENPTADVAIRQRENANMKFLTNNAERMRIDSSGNVGIGTDSPSAPLDVVTDSTVYAAEFKQSNTSNGDGVHIRIGSSAAADYGLRVDSDAGNTAGFVVKADGNVGIGTFTPSHPLTIQSSHQLTDVTGMSGNTTLLIGNTGTGNGVYNALQFSGNQQSMYIASINHGTEASRRLGFFIGSVGGDAVADERLSITGNGNVGIGTTTPDYPLHVKGAGHQRIKVEKTDAGGDADISIANRSDGTGWVLFTDAQAGSNSGVIKYVHNGDYMSFRTNGTDNRLVIDSAGNIGIGTASPAKLGITGSSAGKVLELSGDDSQVRIGNSILHHDNSANTYFHIRNHYGATSALAELSLESGYITFNTGTSFTERMRVKADGDLEMTGYINKTGVFHTSAKQYYYNTYGEHYIRTGGAHGSGTYTLFTNGSSTTQSAGIVEVWGIYGTPSGASYRMYVISGNRNIATAVAHTATNSVPTPTLAWSGAALQISNSNGSLYYHVRVTLQDIGNVWSPTWGNFPGIA